MRFGRKLTLIFLFMYEYSTTVPANPQMAANGVMVHTEFAYPGIFRTHCCNVKELTNKWSANYSEELISKMQLSAINSILFEGNILTIKVKYVTVREIKMKW